MGDNRYVKAEKLLKDLKEEKGENVPFSILKQEIFKKIGSDEARTARPYIKLMQELNMIEATQGGTYVNILI